MSKKKTNQEDDQTSNVDQSPKTETSSHDEIIISKESSTIPAEEKAPDQSILDKPKPNPGISMMASWKHAGSKNK